MRPITVRPEQLNVVSVRSKGIFQPREDEEDPFEPWYAPTTYPMTTENEKEYMSKMKESKGTIVSDGSYKDGRSAAAIVFQHNKTKDIPGNSSNHVTVIVPGPSKEQSSYRGELGGIQAGIAITNSLFKKYNITKGQCRFACDNKGAIAASFGWNRPHQIGVAPSTTKD